jgi:hypothetical protein
MREGIFIIQHADTNLMREAQAALAMEGKHVIKGFMINSHLFGGVEEGMTDGNIYVCVCVCVCVSACACVVCVCVRVVRVIK